MRALELPLIEELLDFYTFYVKVGDEEELKQRAKDINSRFHSASPLVSGSVLGLVFQLVDFFANTGIPRPSKEEALRVIEKLRKRRQELSTSSDRTDPSP